MIELKHLEEISKYAGERFDLVQAGGGNSSVKLDNGEMLIKASGFSLTDVHENNGYSKVFTKEIADIVKNGSIITEKDKRTREALTSQLVNEATIDKANRPSIETLLHSFLHKYTLHTHPVVVNAIVNKKNWKEVLSSLFTDEPIVFVEYNTPGIDLALYLSNELSKFDQVPNIIFLQNHGLIITSVDKDEVIIKTEFVVDKVEKYLDLNFERYKKTNKMSALLNQASQKKLTNNISYLSEDLQINNALQKNIELFLRTPFCPDSLVYCGVKAVRLEDLNDKKTIEEYSNEYFELPKIIIVDNSLYIVAQNIKKAKEIEDVLKFNIMVMMNGADDINYLPVSELGYLSNWEAEKFRQNL